MEEKVEEKAEEKNGEIEYCQDCLIGKCEEHFWFGFPKTENDILANTLKMIVDVLPLIIERVYLVQTVLKAREGGVFFADGQIDFVIEGIASHKKEGYDYYIPLDSYTMGIEGIVDFNIQVKVLITRHNPMVLNIYKDMLCEESIYSVDLIKEDDFLHCEDITNYGEIERLVKERLRQFIDFISEKNKNNGDE